MFKEKQKKLRPKSFIAAMRRHLSFIFLFLAFPLISVIFNNNPVWAELPIKTIYELQKTISLAKNKNVFSWIHQPILLLYERNPWRMVIGSDSPSFILYADGNVIYWDEVETKGGSYKTIQLNYKEVKKIFLDRLSLMESFKKEYILSESTDQQSEEFHYDVGKNQKKIWVYGDLKKDQEARARAPKELLTFYNDLVSFARKDAKPWHPSHIEVMIWPFEYAKESIPWPKAWPGVHDKSAKQRGKDAYSIYLSYKYKNDLKKLMTQLTSSTAMLINGKKYAISVRTPFPHEFYLRGTISK